MARETSGGAVRFCVLIPGHTGGRLCENSSSYTFMISVFSVCILYINSKVYLNIFNDTNKLKILR